MPLISLSLQHGPEKQVKRNQKKRIYNAKAWRRKKKVADQRGRPAPRRIGRKGTDHIAQHASARERSMPKLASYRDQQAGHSRKHRRTMQCPLFICPLYDRYDRSSWSTSCKQANAWVISSASLTWNHDTQQMVALVCTHGRRVFHRCCLHAWDLRCIRNIWLASFSLLLSRDMHAARRSRDIPSFPLLFFKCFSFFPWSVKARLQASCKAHSHEWPGHQV